MPLSSLQQIAAGQFKIQGAITFATVLPLLSQSRVLLNHHKQLSVDLSAVTQTDSAGLALLIEWLRLAEQKNIKIQFINRPKQLENIAKVCGLTTMLTDKSCE